MAAVDRFAVEPWQQAIVEAVVSGQARIVVVGGRRHGRAAIVREVERRFAEDAARGSIQGPSCSCGGAGCVACDHPTESVGGLDVGAETQADRSGLGTHPNTEGGSRG